MLYFDTLPDIQSASKIIADRLRAELTTGQKVLWFLSGGSNIGIEVSALSALSSELQTNLTIMLNDERFGPFGHKDSNMQHLRDAGLSEVHAKVIPVLVPENLSLDATTTRYDDMVRREVAAADTIISQLGMGSDGHIAGILPQSPAISATGAVTSYTSEQYVRITVTFETLRQMNAVYVFAFGQDKRAQLERLRDETVSLSEQPAQFLKQIPEAYVYNDQLETVSAGYKGGNK